MMWIPLVFFLGTFVSGSRSQLVVTQPPSMAKALGSTVMIPCALSSGYRVSEKRGSWYQQKSGGDPVFLSSYGSSDQVRGSGVPERFTISPDASSNLWNLVITGVQAEDDADYYCKAWDNKLNCYHCGSISWGTETETFHF
uniref:Uncharacterized protein n=1 Tax=Sphaerodactylus townsendi TaxID=933632 RepID=A0ACB8FY70_9SAUR